MPYVHGLTIGELARFAKGTPGVLRISEAARLQGRPGRRPDDRLAAGHALAGHRLAVGADLAA